MTNSAKINALIDQALSLHQAGDYAQAEPLYKSALKLRPDDGRSLYFYGILLHQTHRNEDAEKTLGQCAKMVPKDADVNYNLGVVKQALTKYAQAIDCYKKTLLANPSHFLAQLNIGICFSKLGDRDHAVDHLQKALLINPQHIDTVYNLGLVYFNNAQYDLCEKTCDRILEIDAHHGQALLLQSDNFYAQRKYYDADHCLQQCLLRDPTNIVALNKRGDTHRELSAFEQSEKFYRQAIAINDADPQAYIGLGKTLVYAGKIESALDLFIESSKKFPDHADFRNNIALMHLLLGQFSTAWPEYLFRTIERPLSKKPPFAPLPLDLHDKTIYLVPDQGIGDQLFFLRFLPILKQRGARVDVFVDAKIRPVLHHNPHIDALINSEKQIPLQGDIYSLGDLPYLVGADDKTTPPPLPIHIDTDASIEFSLRSKGTSPFIGLTWRAGISGRDSLYKEIALETLIDTIKSIDATWVLLQRQPREDELDVVMKTLGNRCIDATAHNDNLFVMSQWLAWLDDYVGVSNTNMHLRASLGYGGKVLVPNPPDWRWMRQGIESPWMPDFKIYRQTTSGDWSDALLLLKKDLEQLAPR